MLSGMVNTDLANQVHKANYWKHPKLCLKNDDNRPM